MTTESTCPQISGKSESFCDDLDKPISEADQIAQPDQENTQLAPPRLREQDITLKFIAMRFSRCFAYSFMAKVLLRCLFNKFNLYKILI